MRLVLLLAILTALSAPVALAQPDSTNASAPESKLFLQAQADHERWSTWYGRTDGGFRDGATYPLDGLERASLPACPPYPPPGQDESWLDGCHAAYDMLSMPSLYIRLHDDYRDGWFSSSTDEQPPTAAEAPAPIQPPPSVAQPPSVVTNPPKTISDSPAAAASEVTPSSESADQAPAEAEATPQPAGQHGLSNIFERAIVILVVAYFIPSLVAFLRRKRNAFAIFVLNLFLGWTFVGWFAAFIWSVTAEPTNVPPPNTLARSLFDSKPGPVDWE